MTEPKQTKFQRVTNEVRTMLFAGLVLVAGFTALAYLTGTGSSFDWFADFRGIYVFCAMFPLFAWIRHDWRVVAFAAAVIAANAPFVAPWAPTNMTSCEADITAVTINAFGNHSDRDQLVDRLTEYDADIVFVSEIVGDTEPRVSAMYPHSVFYPEARTIGLFTKYPVLESELRYAPGPRPYVIALLDTPRGPLRVIGAHAVAPFDVEGSKLRNADVLELATIAATFEEPTLLLGDLNVTVFSPHYQPLEVAGLRNVRHGQGVNGTWPNFSPIRIPIDHVLATDELQACDVTVGESFESDHLPLIAGLRWRKEAPASNVSLASR